ncbi:MAG: LamG-like jellyroll fold domain-containing protein [Bacteroides sp.]|uniref:BACON domain-containing protein n=1 Tax=Bacteroides sp. TaxID=29523 RepID=UPI0026DFE6E3|nr:LamG-like jellyroll fold domain-containing protein [Bacteroides sp.]MDO5420400.1 LamG-like jellyroll fold domain-containing protein [Bacteroides sp.]
MMNKLIVKAGIMLLLIIVGACTSSEEDTTGSIYGKVTDNKSGEVLQGVTITLTPGGLSRTTGSDGTYEFLDLKAQQYQVQAQKAEYVTNTKSVNVLVGQAASGDMRLTPEKKDAEITITPSSLNFGSTQEEMSVTITNNGNTETEWTLELGSNSWLSANPKAGRIGSNKTQSIVFSVNRDKLGESKSVVVNLSAFGNSFPISVSCSPKDGKKPEMGVSPTTLDFGDSAQEQTLEIKNTGEANLNWKIEGITSDCITVSENEGTVAPAGNKVVQVKLDRSKMTGDLSTSFIVSDGTKEEAVTVKAVKAKAVLSISPKNLDFGEEQTEMKLNIGNTGNAELSWNITNVSDGCLSVSATSGKVPVQGSSEVTVTLNRSTMPQTLNATITVSDGTQEEKVAVTAAKGSAIAGTVVPEGMYVYYKFDDDFNDATENAVHGFGANSPTFVEGVAAGSKAVKFNRTDNSSFVVAKPIIDSRDMTISFWGKDFGDGNIFYMVSSHQNQSMFTLSMMDGALKFIVTLYNNNYQYSKTGTFMHPTLTDGKWHHVALTSDFNKTTYATITTNLYVDGQLVDVVTEDANPFTEGETGSNSYGSGIKFVLGGSAKLYTSTLNGTNMTVDNFRVYDTRRLSAAEIKSIYDARQ